MATVDIKTGGAEVKIILHVKQASSPVKIELLNVLTAGMYDNTLLVF